MQRFLTPLHMNSNFCLKHSKATLAKLKWWDSSRGSGFCSFPSLYRTAWGSQRKCKTAGLCFCCFEGMEGGKGSSNPKRLPWTPRWHMKSEGIQILCGHKKIRFIKTQIYDLMRFLDICSYLALKITWGQEKHSAFPAPPWATPADGSSTH